MKTIWRWLAMVCAIGTAWGFLPAVADEGPVVLTTQHVDLRISYDPTRTNLLDLLLVDDDAHPARVLASTNAILIAAEASRLELPGDLPPLGSAGDPLWVLPASQADGLLYLGISGEGNPLGVFSGPFTLRLLAVRGPGHFFLWQSELGLLNFFMNSRDGIQAEDAFPQLVGGHSHADWGFTTAGVYRVTFQAEARRVGESTNLLSPPREFTFHVLPLPPEPASPFRDWQETHWPGQADAAQAVATADPDGDGWANLWEYALGTDPKSATSGSGARPMPVPSSGPGAGGVTLGWSAAAGATDVEYALVAAERVTGPWSEVTAETTSVAEGAGTGPVRWTLRDARPSAGRTTSFYRVEIRLKVGP